MKKIRDKLNKTHEKPIFKAIKYINVSCIGRTNVKMPVLQITLLIQ